MDDPFPEGMLVDIARVIATDREPAGLLSYDAVFNSGLMFPLQRRTEMEAMLRLAKELTPRVVVEIGADKGGGCYHWLKTLQPQRFIGIEIRGTPYGKLLSEAFRWTTCLWIGASSYDPVTVCGVSDFLAGQPIDVLFIDGDKSRFYEDFTAYLPLVRLGGMVFMHDIRDEAPRAGFERARQHPRVHGSTTIEDISEVGPALEREARGIPPANAHEGWLRAWRGASCGVGVLWV